MKTIYPGCLKLFIRIKKPYKNQKYAIRNHLVRLSTWACEFTDSTEPDQFPRLILPFKLYFFEVIDIHFHLDIAKIPTINTGSSRQLIKPEFFLGINLVLECFLRASKISGVFFSFSLPVRPEPLRPQAWPGLLAPVQNRIYCRDGNFS